MTTIITNVLTREKMTFVNDQSLTENLINAIIGIKKETSNLLNPEFRNKYRPLIKTGTSKDGQKIAFCYSYDLIAR